jgi:hypothetical protein
MPDLNAVHIDRALTNLSIRYTNPAYIGEIMFPVLPVQKESDKYFIYGKEHYARHGTLRADGAEANEFNWTVSTGTYTCEEYALRTPVTDRERANADTPISPDVDATEMLTDAIKLDWEVRYQTTATTAASYATGHSAAAATQYNSTSGSFMADVLTGQEVIRRGCQMFPNYIFIPSRVAMYVAQNSTVLDLIKYTHADLLIVGPNQSWVLPPVLWGMKVVVMMSVQNTANLAQAESLSDIWDDTIIMAYINPGPGLKKISWGYTIQARNWQTKRWREEAREADMVEVTVIRTAKITCPACAYRITDCLAAAYQ